MSSQAFQLPRTEAVDPLGSLAELAPGTPAVIVSVEAAGAIGERLLDLGLIPGTQIRAVRRAPLGDPRVYELRGYRLCLRRSEAERVLVRPGEAARPPIA